MNDERMSIQELADATGVSRRTIRYYVQRGLLPAPEGVGRGRHYTQRHLEQLLRVRALQEAGHSLSEIAALIGSASDAVDGLHREAPAAPPALHFALRHERMEPSPAPQPEVRLETRVRIDDGIELVLAPPSRLPEPDTLTRLAQMIRTMLAENGDDNDRDD